MPLLKRGIPVSTVHIENLEYPNTLKNVKVLIMSYSNMKPMKKESHTYLAEWVKNGGVLVYCGRDNDPYQKVMEWWNSDDNAYDKPSDHLFERLGIKTEESYGKFNVGKGFVYVVRQNPKEFVLQEKGEQKFVDIIKEAYKDVASAGDLQFKNNFYLERGPYIIVSVMDESVTNRPYTVNGSLIDLFNPDLPVLTEKMVHPGTEALLYDINSVKDKNKPRVLATAARIYGEAVKRKQYSFVAKSPLKTTNSMRILLPSEPKVINVRNAQGEELTETKSSWDDNSHTCWLSFENNPEGIYVTINM